MIKEIFISILLFLSISRCFSQDVEFEKRLHLADSNCQVKAIEFAKSLLGEKLFSEKLKLYKSYLNNNILIKDTVVFALFIKT